jgi:hypothetical protein
MLCICKIPVCSILCSVYHMYQYSVQHVILLYEYQVRVPCSYSCMLYLVLEYCCTQCKCPELRTANVDLSTSTSTSGGSHNTP